jgi:hypothetical protein
MKGGGIEIGERLKCPKCGTRLVASRDPDSGRTGAASESQGGAWVLHDASAPPPAPVSTDPDDEPLEYSLRVEAWQRPGAVVDPPVGGDPSAHVGGETEKAEYPSPVLPNGIRRPPTPVKRDGRVRRKRPGEEEEPAEEAVLVWQPGRGVSLWRLFFAGTFTFPFRPGVLIYVVFLLTMHLLSVLQLGIGVSSPFYVGFVGGAFLAACAWGMLASCYGLTILRDTSYGADNVEWPSLLTLDALGDLGYVVTSLFFAVLPGWGVATLGQSPSEETLVVMVVSALLLFPVFLLSTLETNSPIQPYSLPVWQSVVRAQSAWILFYLLSFVLAFVAGPLAIELSFVAIEDFGGSSGILAGAGAGAVLGVAWMVYFRLLGRLAWYCANRPLRERVE